MSTEKSCNEYIWLTYDDLSKLSGCDENKQSKLIVIKAPPGTRMEIPNPEEVDTYFKDMKKKAETKHGIEAEEPIHKEREIEDKKYQIQLCSKTDKIMVYTVENDDEADYMNMSPSAEKEHNDLSQLESLSNMYGK